MVWNKNGFQINILFCLIYIILLSVVSFSQVPTLDPDQTVNLATGEMGFSLPLGTVQGTNGKDFPITLNYQAGIRYNQEASPAGLGFSYGPGGISRKVVFVPDDNVGGPGSFKMSKTETPTCDESKWGPLYNFISLAVTSILSCIYPPATAFAITANFISSVSSTVSFVVSMATTFTPSDFKAGGSHIKAYKPLYKAVDSMDGKGFFYENCEHRDLPDIYCVNTPFISGELVWCGEYNNKKDGYFVFKNTKGSSGNNTRTVRVDYFINEEKYLITLADGTRLFFEDTLNSNSYSKTYWQMGGPDCKLDNIQKQNQRVPDQWLLSKVIYPDSSWIEFDYVRRRINNSRPLPKTIQLSKNVSMMHTPGSDPVDANSSIFEELVIKKIRTPNESAEFYYSESRLDNLWFHASAMEWFVPQRGQQPAEKRVKMKKSFTGEPYIKGSALDSIVIYSSNNQTLRTIRLNKSYKLKQGSFRSFSKDTNGNFTTIPGNPQAGCLTLECVEILDQLKSTIYTTFFEYINDSTYKFWDSTQISSPLGPDPMPFYVERKDYWGYFFFNTGPNNDFNKDGRWSYDPLSASLWSAKKVEFSTGLKISWDYDLNRYDAANGRPVSGFNSSTVKYGGGTRVRTMTVDDGMGKNYKRSYFYTDSAGIFIANNNTSGHATVEPYPYLSESQDKRDTTARGGHYTACKIGYEMVQVVDNYQPDSANPAPNGYTVYEYITPADDSPSEFFRNEGKYGEIDNSWKRGFLKRKRVFDKSNTLITDEMVEYEFVEQNKIDQTVLSILDSMDSYLYEDRFGWVKQKCVNSSFMGVNSFTVSKYATDLNDTDAVDKQEIPRKELKVFDAGINLKKTFGNSGSDVNGFRSLTCRTKTLQGTDTTKYDYILAATTYGAKLFLCAGTDLSDDTTLAPIVRAGKWTSWCDINLPYDFNNILGLEILDVDGTDNKDLIVVTSTEHTDTSWVNANGFFNVHVFPNIRVETITSGVKLCWDGNDPRCTIIRLNNADRDYLNTFGGHAYLDGCIIKNFYGGPQPDFLFFTNVRNNGRLPGDLGYIPPNGKLGRRIIAFTDFQEVPSVDCGFITSMTMYKDTNTYYFYGNIGFFASNNDSSSNYDVIIGGPGRIIELGDPNSFDKLRFVSYQVFENIKFDTVFKTIWFDNPCSNCSDSDRILFNAKPIVDKNWGATRCAGLYQQGDTIRYIFHAEMGNTPTFQITDLVTSNYPGDYDGLPNRSWTKNSDNTITLTTSTPAWFKYGLMGNPNIPGNLHQLTQQCGSTVYHFPAATKDSILIGDLSIHTNKVISASANTRDSIKGNFLPKATYSWNVPTNQNGLPLTNFTPFNFDSGTINTNWYLIDSITKYTSYNRINENTTPLDGSKKIFSSLIYGHNGLLPIGSVGNAHFEECGVFTCDYDDSDTGYFDKRNGWESVNGMLSKTKTHFGQASVRIQNGSGPQRKFRLTKNRDYIMTAWVNVVKDTVYMGGDFRFIQKSLDTLWPVMGLTLDAGVSLNSVKQGPTSGKWVFISIKIPASHLLASKDWSNNNWYTQMRIGTNNGGDVYVDDIRFYPDQSTVTSTYYDSLFGLPIINVDANNNPGQRITYDGFERPVKWEKIDPSKSSGDVGFTILLQEKRYFFQGEGLVITSPNRGDKYNVDGIINITWRNVMNRRVRISISDIADTSGNTWILIDTIINVNYLNYKIPQSLPSGDTYRIKVEDIDSTEIYDISEEFLIEKGKVLYPESGSILETGSTEPIIYYMYGDTTIGLNINVNGIMVGKTKNTGTFIWNVPPDFTPSDSVVIEISSPTSSIRSELFTVKKRGFIKRKILRLFNR